jgi:hypothetical protein
MNFCRIPFAFTNNTAKILYALTVLLMSTTISAQTIVGTNVGPIADGASTGPANCGAPRDVRFVNTNLGMVVSIDLAFRANHLFVGDSRVTLISPQGIEHLLLSEILSSNHSESLCRMQFSDPVCGFWYAELHSASPPTAPLAPNKPD